MTDLLERVLVPVAETADARTTARGLARYLGGEIEGRDVVVVHVLETAGGAPDEASVEQREELAAEAFDAFREAFGTVAPVETEIRYGTDVAETIFAAAEDHGASAIAFTPRDAHRLLRMLTGDVAMSLVTETDRPVIVLPDVDPSDEGSVDE